MVSKKRKTLQSFIVFVFCVLAVCPNWCVSAMTQFSAHSDVPYDSYAYWEIEGEFKAVYTKPLFDCEKVITSSMLKTEEFKELTDLSVSKDGYVCILDSNSRILVLTPDYQLYKEIKSAGDKEFSGAKGVFATDESIYISDTQNERVLITDKDGRYQGELLRPESTIIPEDFAYKPIKTVVDPNGYKYVLCDGSFYGALLFSPENEFLSFFGANTVKTGVVQALGDLWDKLTMTDEKYEKQARKYPYQFVDLCLDSEGFVYTATSKTDGAEWLQKGVIRMLAPNGNDIIDTAEVVFGEKQVPLTFGRGFYIHAQNMGGVTVDDDDFFYTFDTTYNKIYMYDHECNNVCVFGGGFDSGRQKGTFQKITAIEHKGDDLIAIDGIKNTITLFTCNEYGKQFKTLQTLTLKGEYAKAKEGWESILDADRNNRFAYMGLAKAAYAQGDYKEAMSLSKIAFDKETYAQAYVQLRKEFIHNNIVWIVLGLLAVIGLGIFLVRRGKKKEIVLNGKVKVLKNTVFHPAVSFTEIKQKDLSSVGIGAVILVLYFISAAMQTLLGSFMFVSKNTESFNSLLLLFRTVGLVLLWTVANWAVCCLFGGIGKVKEIFTVVCYSLVPMIFANFLYIILTHIFVPDEVAFLSTIMTAITLYSLIMIVIGTIIIHDFSFGKFVGTTVLTVLAMAIILFIIVLIVILVQQFIAFGTTIYNEITFR